jgi:thiol peroxidase
MAAVKFKGSEVHTCGELPKTGTQAHDFALAGQDLGEVRLSDYLGKRVVLNIFPSLDTATCAMSVRKFNKWVSEKENTVVICISKDLPFAQKRFCGAEGLENVITASDFRTLSFAHDYGVLLINGILRGLMTRAVIAIDETGKVIYNQLVEEITEEPSYDINVFG